MGRHGVGREEREAEEGNEAECGGRETHGEGK